MDEKNMPLYDWAEAISINVYIMNKTPTIAVHDMMLKRSFLGKNLI